MIKENTWVTIEKIILTAAERPHSLPDDTKKTDLRMQINGTLLSPAEPGAQVSVITTTGRTEYGMLTGVNPSIAVGYGSYVPEIRQIREQVKNILWGTGEICK